MKVFQDDASLEAGINADGTKMVYFWAEWCGPCKMFAPILSEAAHVYQGRVDIMKATVDDCPRMAEAYGVRSVPTLVAFKGSRVIDIRHGALTKSALGVWLQALTAQ